MFQWFYSNNPKFIYPNKTVNPTHLSYHSLQAIARKLQEKEMKEERRRQKQVEAKHEEDYFEDHGGGESNTDSVDVLLFPFHACISSCRTTWMEIFFS